MSEGDLRGNRRPVGGQHHLSWQQEDIHSPRKRSFEDDVAIHEPCRHGLFIWHLRDPPLLDALMLFCGGSRSLHPGSITRHGHRSRLLQSVQSVWNSIVLRFDAALDVFGKTWLQ